MLHSVTHLVLCFTSSLQQQSASAGILWSGRQPTKDGWRCEDDGEMEGKQQKREGAL